MADIDAVGTDVLETYVVVLLAPCCHVAFSFG